MKSIFFVVISFCVLAGNANATIIILDEHVDQEASWIVLGDTYSVTYSGNVSGVNPYTAQNFALLFHEDDDGFGVFDGFSTDLNNPDGGAFFYGFTESTGGNGSISFRLNSDRWNSGYGGAEIDEIYYNSIQNSFIDYKQRFRVDGSGDALSLDRWIEDSRFGSIYYTLRDHTAGIEYGFDELHDYSLENGHVYTIEALLRNTAWGEHTVAGGVSFPGSSVHVPEPSSLVLFCTGALAILGIRRRKRI